MRRLPGCLPVVALAFLLALMMGQAAPAVHAAAGQAHSSHTNILTAGPAPADVRNNTRRLLPPPVKMQHAAPPRLPSPLQHEEQQDQATPSVIAAATTAAAVSASVPRDDEEEEVEVAVGVEDDQTGPARTAAATDTRPAAPPGRDEPENNSTGAAALQLHGNDLSAAANATSALVGVLQGLSAAAAFLDGTLLGAAAVAEAEAEEEEKDGSEDYDEGGDDPGVYTEAPPGGYDGTDGAAPCSRPMLSPPFLDRRNPSALNNAYAAAVLTRIADPASFGISGSGDAAQASFQGLCSRKLVALGAQAESIKFLDAVPGQGGGRLAAWLAKHQPAAHALVFATAHDVFVVFRGDAHGLAGMASRPTAVRLGGRRVHVNSDHWHALQAIWPELVLNVKRALLRTQHPQSARIFLAGHGPGAVHATFAALKLADMGLSHAFGGLQLFGAPPAAGRRDFVSLFRASGLSRVTTTWWNELDPVPDPKRAHHKYKPLPASTLHRIWRGACARTNQAAMEACGPAGYKHCKAHVSDYQASAYAVKLQTCVLRQPDIAESSCLKRQVMGSM